MTTDDSLHLLGTKSVHQVPGWLAIGVGHATSSEWLVGAGGGILVVLLFGTMRAQSSETYRWRVDDGVSEE